jgi:Cd2+/Zn2+-exporting ATPase
MIMLFYQTGTYFQNLAVLKSKRNITKLMDIRPDYANLQIDGEVRKVAPETVSIGDIIIVKPGEKIPLDGIVIDGESMLDTTALTGESMPRRASTSDMVLSGCVNQNGVLSIEVTQTFGESTASKIIDLVENAASKKAPSENFITKFARYYTPVVVILAVLVAVVPLMFGGMWDEWLRRGLIFLVISCPCALVISIPLSFFGGLGGASRKGILMKGGNYLEALTNLDIAVFDKTGTLTKGVFKVTQITPSCNFSESDLLETAAKAETFSNHPIALSILREYGRHIDKTGLTDYNEIAGYGVSVSVKGKIVSAGNNKLMTKMGIAVEAAKTIGTKVHVAVDNDYMGYIVISDEIKSDSFSAISGLKALGVKKTVMLTGDDLQIAEAIASELEIDEVYAGLLPHEKVEKVETLIERNRNDSTLPGQKRSKGKLAFVGDGINDAPVLAIADIGVAMGGLGSDAAIEAADVVLMTDEPSKLAEAVKLARFTKRIVWQNIALALGIKAVFMVLGTMGVASLWEAVFADVGVALLAIFNAMRVK